MNDELKPGIALGVASLVIGILCLIALGLVFSIVGIVCGVLSLNTQGRAVGTAGLILCIIATVIRFTQVILIHFS